MTTGTAGETEVNKPRTELGVLSSGPGLPFTPLGNPHLTPSPWCAYLYNGAMALPRLPKTKFLLEGHESERGGVGGIINDQKSTQPEV